MLNFKPSELPVGTTIETEEYVFTKIDNSIYGILWNNQECEDCQGGMDLSDEQADKLLTDFKIISVPFTMLQYVVADMQDISDNDFTQEFLIKDAMKHHLDEDSVKHYV